MVTRVANKTRVSATVYLIEMYFWVDAWSALISCGWCRLCGKLIGTKYVRFTYLFLILWCCLSIDSVTANYNARNVCNMIYCTALKELIRQRDG